MFFQSKSVVFAVQFPCFQLGIVSLGYDAGVDKVSDWFSCALTTPLDIILGVIKLDYSESKCLVSTIKDQI